MSLKSIKFKKINQIISVSSEAAKFLKLYFNSIDSIYAGLDQNEVVFDLQTSVYEKLKQADSTPAKLSEVHQAIAKTHNLDPDELKEIDQKQATGFYLDSSEAAIGGVCAMIARNLRIPKILIRLFVLGLLFTFGIYTLMIYLMAWILVPSNRNFTEQKLTDLIKAQTQITLDSNSSDFKNTGIIGIVSRIVAKAASVSIFILSCYFFLLGWYLVGGVLLGMYGWWWDVLLVDSDLNNLTSYFFPISALHISGMIVMSYYGIKISRVLTKGFAVSNKVWRQNLIGFGVGAILFSISVYGLLTIPLDVFDQTKKEQTYEKLPKISVLNNSLCSQNNNYRILMFKSNQNKISIHGPASRILAMSIGNQDSGAVVTNDYPFQSCWFYSQQNVAIIVETTETVMLDDWTHSSITTYGLKSSDIELTNNIVKPLVIQQL